CCLCGCSRQHYFHYNSEIKAGAGTSARAGNYTTNCKFSLFSVPSQAPLATSDPLAFISFSAKGHTVHLAERRSVAIQNVNRVVFVQTDKPIYKPGQTAVFCSLFQYPLITLQDPQNNRIFQWLDVTSKNAIAQLSFLLIQEPILGSYRIVVEKKSGDKTYQHFTVEEYVLPKFEMKIKAPKRISFLDQELKVNVCAVYTYGQPVQGRVQLSVCRKHYNERCNENPKGICEAITAQFSLKPYSPSPRFLYLLHPHSGVQITGFDYISIYQARQRMWFKNMDMYYKRGIPYTGQDNDIPVANEIIRLELNGKHVADYVTNPDGAAWFSIDTSKLFRPKFNLLVLDADWVDDYQSETSYYIHRFYSHTNSFVKIERVQGTLRCGQEKAITVHYILNKKGYGDVTTPTGTFFIPLTVSEKLAPRAKMLLYTVHPGGELVADSISFEIEKCFRNKVQLQFSKDQGLPASNVSLHIEAAANSHCALRAVDQSVLLLRPEQQLSAETVSLVYNQLLIHEYYGYYYKGLNLEDSKKEPCIPVTDTFFNGLYYVPVNVTTDGDVYGVFRVCLLHLENILQTVRIFSHFVSCTLSANGKASVSFTIPDTITEWKASAFCLDEEAGFGISPTTSLKAFQPFFVDLTRPYSVVRGEKFNLIANVFNYLDKCTQVLQVLSLSFLSSTPSSSLPENLYLLQLEQGAAAVQNQNELWILLDGPPPASHVDGGSRIKRDSLLLTSIVRLPCRLTASVYKSFEQAKRYIYIDDHVQSQTLIWLASKQKPDGCFQHVGNRFNNALENGLACLDAASASRVFNSYDQALLAYTYGLAGNEEKWKFFLEELKKSATKVGGSVHWEREKKPLAEKFPSFYSRAASAEVEMTSYVVLALLQRPTLTPEELSYVAQIVQWIAKQQNPYGGFSSTQVAIDTVVALQALALYGYLTFSKDNQNTVEISSRNLQKVFRVDNRNRLLLQQVSLPSLPGNYSVQVEGSGCVYLLSHFSYTGKRNTSNMAIIDVKMLSGHVPVSSSLKKVQEGGDTPNTIEQTWNNLYFPSPSILYNVIPRLWFIDYGVIWDHCDHLV
uniref:Ovostatin n=1 Tax=Pelusios castaneus TaxID=367368 RepID=A0A8C8S640_9SAUR